MNLARETSKRVDLDASFLKRGVNEGFLRWREEAQRDHADDAAWSPQLCISRRDRLGLDIDALQGSRRWRQRAIARQPRSFSSLPLPAVCSNYIVPDYVTRVWPVGRIVQIR